MQFCGQFGIVQAAHADIEIRWFVNVAVAAPLGGKPQPALFPVRCPPALGPASLEAPSLVVMAPVASLNEASLLATPLAAPLLLPDAAPLATPDVDSSTDPELEPVAPTPLPTAEPAPDPVLEVPLLLPAPPAPEPLAPFWAGPGPLWLALQAAATRAAQNNPCRKDTCRTSTSVEARAPSDHPADLFTRESTTGSRSHGSAPHGPPPMELAPFLYGVQPRWTEYRKDK
jgi:hypothetical protein